tara:strand:+ start:5227 stop:5661 length:435 start_codon:yes stop_codon:yes gene_type:complete
MKYLAIICSSVALFACGNAAAQTAALPSHGASTLPQTEWSKNFTSNAPVAPITDAGSMLVWQEQAQAFKFGGNGRWQMNLNVVTRLEDSPLPREEYRAGATYQFTPRFSLSGSLSVGADELNDMSQWQEQEVEAGVRLKTTFKF